jgi:hypothetical protein
MFSTTPAGGAHTIFEQSMQQSKAGNFNDELS